MIALYYATSALPQVALDSGTRMMAAPGYVVGKLQEEVGAASDCSNFASLPGLRSAVGGDIQRVGPGERWESWEFTEAPYGLPKFGQ